jgi:hypothetical protein
MSIQANLKMGVRGQYKLQVRKGVWDEAAGRLMPGEIVRETPWCKNVITATGLNFFLNRTSVSGNSVFMHCVVGTGNTAPAIGDSTLATYRNVYSIVQSYAMTRNSTTPPYWNKHSIVYRFDAGAASGNIAEAGLVFSTSSSIASINGSTAVSSRALIVDGGGSPTTVAVAADEFLDVTYELFWYLPTEASGNFNQTIDGAVVSTAYVLRPLNIDQVTGPWHEMNFVQGTIGGSNGYCAMSPIYPYAGNGSASVSSMVSAGAISTVTGDTITGTLNSTMMASSVSAAAYTSGTYYRDFTYNWDLNKGNVSISALQVHHNWGAWQMSLSPAVPKTNTKTYSFTIRISLANYP